MSVDLGVAILAAGGSSRLGQPKQLVSIGGEPLLRRQCRVAIESACGPVGVVLGCESDRSSVAIADLPVVALINAQWQKGLGASIRCAVQWAIGSECRGVLLVHADQYRLTSDDLRRLTAVWNADQA